MAIEINDNHKIKAPKTTDSRNMKFVGGVSVPYASVAECNTLNPFFRSAGVYYFITIDGQTVPHHYNGGLSDGSLVPVSIGVYTGVVSTPNTPVGKVIYPADTGGVLLKSADQSSSADDVVRISIGGVFYDKVIDGPLRASNLKLFAGVSDQTAKFNTAVGKAICTHLVFDKPGTNVYTINGTVTIPNNTIITVRGQNSFTGTGTINGGTWDISDTQQIWDSTLTVNPYNFTSGYIPAASMGVLPGGTEMSDNFQKVLNWAVSSTKTKRIYVAIGGTYIINDVYILKNPGTTNVGQSSITIEGVAASSGQCVVFHTNDAQAATIHITQGIGVYINNIAFDGANPTFIPNFITGDWTFGGTVRSNHVSPHCAISIDAIYTGAGTQIGGADDYYAGLPSSLYNNVQQAGSTNVILTNCNFNNYFAAITEGLSGCPNGENIIVRNSFGFNCKHFWIAGQLQSRENLIEGCYFYGGDAFITNIGYGTQIGDVPTVMSSNVNICKYLYYTQGDFTTVRFINGYSEGMWSCGFHSGNTSATIANWNFSLADKNSTGTIVAPSPIFAEGPLFLWLGGKIEFPNYHGPIALNCRSAEFSNCFIRGDLPFNTNIELFDNVTFNNILYTGDGGVSGHLLTENHHNNTEGVDESTYNGTYFLPGSEFKSKTHRTWTNVGQKIDRISVGAYTITLNSSTRIATFTPDDAGRFKEGDVIVVDESINNGSDIYSSAPTAMGYVTGVSSGVVTVDYVPGGFTTATAYTMYVARIPFYIGRAIGTTTSGSNTITALQVDNPSALFRAGDRIKGAGIPLGTWVTGVDTGAHTITMSTNATANATGVELYDTKCKVVSDTLTFLYFGSPYTIFALGVIWFKGDEVYNLTSIFNLRSYYCTVAGIYAGSPAPTFINIGAVATIITVNNGGSFDNGTGIFTNGLPSGFVMDTDGSFRRVFNANAIEYQSNITSGNQHTFINSVGNTFVGDSVVKISTAADTLAAGQNLLSLDGDAGVNKFQFRSNGSSYFAGLAGSGNRLLLASSTGVLGAFTTATDYADNAAALVGGLVAGNIYRTGDVLKIVH